MRPSQPAEGAGSVAPPRWGGLGGLTGLINGFTAEELAPLISSFGLIAGRMASMGLGFLAWLVAARLFSAAEVGLASGVVAAMMLCVQLAMVGVGSAVIALLPGYRDHPGRLLNPAFTSVSLAAVVAALLFLVVARAIFHELDVVVTIPVLALAFVAMTLFGAVNVLYDNASVAMRRGDQVLTRNIAFGLVTIAVPVALVGLVPGHGSWLILAAWTLAGVVACVLGFIQTARMWRGYRLRLQLDAPLVGRLVRVGLPNWALTMTERGPALLMPILVTEFISPTVNAYWYAAWMMAWVVMIIPISAGQTLFAEAARSPDRVADVTRHGLLTSLGLGVPAAIAMAVLAQLALSLLGAQYADAGEAALRILVITVIPFSLLQAYFAICRARLQLGEAIAVGTISGTVAVIAAIAAGQAGGLTAMAAAWLVVQLIAGAWAGVRIWSLTRGLASGIRGAAAETPSASDPAA
jgi:O-antigen/teichoic acid export membrane protein